MSHYANQVLSGLMSHGKETWQEFGGQLSAEMFGGDSRAVFKAIEALYAADRLVDPVNVAEKLGSEYHELVQYIANEYSSRPTFGAQIKELQITTNANRAKDIGAMLMETGDFEAARAQLDTIGDTSAKSETVNGHAALKLLVGDLQSKIDQDMIGLSTGLKDLDGLLAGLTPADLILIAGRPSMGKTALALNVGNHVRANHCPVGVFSLEMPTEKLMARLVSSYGVNAGRLKTPKLLTDTDWDKITRAMEKLHTGHEIHFNDIGGLSIGALEAEARRMVKHLGCGLLIIDYLQLVTCKAERRMEEVSEVSRRLKALAKNLKVPIIALCQLNRQSEGAVNPVPTLAMLRESGQLEQDADVVVFVDRPSVRMAGDREGEGDLIVAKNRDGECGTAAVSWQGHFQRFGNLERHWYPGTADQDNYQH